MITLLLGLLWMQDAAAPTPAAEFETERLRQLRGVRRVHIEKLSGENADHIRDLLIASLQESRLFVVTENAEKADAIIKGSTQYSAYVDTFQYGESVNTRGSSGASRTNRALRSGSFGVGENESARISERRELAAATLRMVNQDGDVIWSTTQESRGAKFRGAAPDVTDKVARKLLEDYSKLRK